MNEEVEKNQDLFRTEVLEAQQSTWLGDVVLSYPLSFRLMAMFSAAVVMTIFLFGYFGTYTKKSTVVGQIMPVCGIVRVYTSQPGIVLVSYVKEGQQVKTGDRLFLVSSDRTSALGSTQAVISSSILAQKGLLGDKMAIIKALESEDRSGLSTRIASYRKELSDISEMMRIQEQRVAVAQDLASRYRQLLAQQFVSEADVQNRQAELLDQQSRLTNLQRDRTEAVRNLANTENELHELSLKTNSNLNDVQAQLHTTTENLSESESKRGTILSAPVNGTVTTIMGHIGQWADITVPVVSILPKSCKLQAELYATSKAVGFVRVGDTVGMRYEAFPYQKYGVYRGRVTLISRTALTAGELAGIEGVLTQRSNPEDRGAPLYRIAVALESQSVWVNGKQEQLQAGMLLEASVEQETRRLYEWILEPLYTVIGPPRHQTH